MQCYNCNNIYNDYLGYCPYCGVKKEEFNICSNCEEKLTKDILICPKCGEEPIEETKEMKSDRLNREGVEHQMSDSSIDYFNEALRFNKNNIDAWVNKSKTLNFGTLYKANKCCDAGLKINKDNKKLLLAKAIALKKDERDSDENNSDIILNDLLKRCDQDLQENRFNVDIWILKGEVLNKLDNQKGAIECYSNALEINPKNEKLWVRKAELCWYDSDYISEVESYKKALELNPTNATYYKKIGDAYEGYLNDNKNAIKYYNNALELDYDDKYLWVTKGRLEKEIGKYDDALKSFNFAAKLNPNHDGALLNKAEIFCKLNCFEEAIECYDEALKIFSNDWVKNLKANALIELERYEDALEVYDENIKGNPDYEDTYFKKGKLLNELGRFEEEVECYELLLNEDDCSYNDYKRAQLCKGIALLEIDKEKAENYFNKLLEDCNRSLEIFPDNGRYWERKADIFYFSGKYEESFKCYDKALNCDVYNKAELISSKAQSLYKLKKYEKAIELFDEALKISNFVYAFKYKGYCLEELNKYDEAIDCYNKYLEIKPKDKEVLSKKSKLNEKIK